MIQINDTHPSMVIPELIRLLTAKGLSFDAALDQVRRTCAYTNHTILAEALEKWPLSFIEKVAPQLVPVIQELDRRMKEAHPDPRVAIIDGQDRVHMAHMDIHCGFSVNGVAALHTEILKNSELKPFYDIYPEKFNNKNQRRHPPPVAGGLRSPAHRPDRRLHRRRLAAGRPQAGEAAGLPGG